MPAKQETAESAVYLAARREWNERYGDYIAQARNWRYAAFGAIVVAGLAVGHDWWNGRNNHPVPYIVETNKLGDQLAVARADVASPIDKRIIRARLGQWIADVRSVYSDEAAQTRIVNDALAIMDVHASGRHALKDWYSEHDPFRRARDETVSVAVASVIPLSADTWRIEWTETKHATQGGGADVYENWQARVTFTVSPPTDDLTIMKNPAGIWIESWDWSQRQ